MFKNENCLYLVLTEEYCNKPAIQVAAEAIDAGIDCLQMREKAKTWKELLELGGKLKALCKDIPFIVNDDPHLAMELDADGVHLGQDDFKKYPDIWTIMKRKIIGISTHCVEEVKRANDLDVDYIAFGPVFETKTKDYSIGTSHIEQVLKIATKPVVFIGGIYEDNIGEVTSLGAKNIAVIRAITQSEDIAAIVKRLKSKMNCHPEPFVSLKGKLREGSVSKVSITLNGKIELIKSRTLIDLLEEKNFDRKMVIIEYNKEVANPSEWDAINLKDNDNLEIVSMFAGG